MVAIATPTMLTAHADIGTWTNNKQPNERRKKQLWRHKDPHKCNLLTGFYYYFFSFFVFFYSVDVVAVVVVDSFISVRLLIFITFSNKEYLEVEPENIKNSIGSIEFIGDKFPGVFFLLFFSFMILFFSLAFFIIVKLEHESLSMSIDLNKRIIFFFLLLVWTVHFISIEFMYFRSHWKRVTWKSFFCYYGLLPH